MDRSTMGFTQMGGEGVPWVGQQPFTTDKHMFTNLGDGTYFHSGLLAIRQSIAAGVNITYKILYNDAVAMTGGQQVGERPEGHSVVQIAQSVRAEGAVKIVVVTDEPEKYDGVKLVEGVTVHHRDELDTIQREFREIMGTTVIIYDQTCATEKRRRRKRGTMVDPASACRHQRAGLRRLRRLQRAVQLHERGAAGDRIRPQAPDQPERPATRTCLVRQGLLPELHHRRRRAAEEKGQGRQKIQPVRMRHLARADCRSCWTPTTGRSVGIVVAGVGGTGVITIGQLLGMAAHIEGKGIVTQDAAGLAQKGGSTWSHVLIGDRQTDIRTTRVGTASADLIIGCDPLVAAGKETMAAHARRPHACGAECAQHADGVIRAQRRLATPADACRPKSARP
jgi:indolepyruvate ferredoxin oxidoreductase